MLKDVQLFSGFSGSELEALEAHSVAKSIRKNTLFIDKGDESSSLYVIVSGKVKVFISDENGKEIILNTMGEGEYFGELALLADMPRTASVMTLEDSKFIVITKAAFSDCLKKHADMSLKLIQSLAYRVAALTENVSNLALGDVYTRVAAALQNQAKKIDGERVIERITQQQLADMVGATRQMVSLIFRDLKSGGYLTIENRRITINKKLPAHW